MASRKKRMILARLNDDRGDKLAALVLIFCLFCFWNFIVHRLEIYGNEQIKHNCSYQLISCSISSLFCLFCCFVVLMISHSDLKLFFFSLAHHFNVSIYTVLFLNLLIQCLSSTLQNFTKGFSPTHTLDALHHTFHPLNT